MIDKAIARITSEMMEDGSDFARFIEEYLTKICTTEKVAEKLLDPEKSLKEFVKNITQEFREKAKKKGSGLQAVGESDQYFYDKVEEYFEIKSKGNAAGKIDVLDFM